MAAIRTRGVPNDEWPVALTRTPDGLDGWRGSDASKCSLQASSHVSTEDGAMADSADGDRRSRFLDGWRMTCDLVQP